MINYLDFYNIFVNEIIGSADLFVLIFICTIIFIGIKKNINLGTLVMLSGLFVFAMAVWTGKWVYFIYLFVGLIFANAWKGFTSEK